MIEVGELIVKNIYLSLSVACIVTAITTYLITGGIKAVDDNKNGALTLEKDTTSSTSSVNQDCSKAVSPKIKVDLAGAVPQPGLYELPTDARLADLLKLGGGVDNSASDKWVAKNLNLALKLSDAQKVYIPFEWDINADDTEFSADLGMTYAEAVSYISSNSSTTSENDNKLSDDSQGMINVNTADASELDTLPGIGAVYAAKITNNRPYNNLQELIQKTGISASVIEKFESLISF